MNLIKITLAFQRCIGTFIAIGYHALVLAISASMSVCRDSNFWVIVTLGLLWRYAWQFIAVLEISSRKHCNSIEG